MKPNPIRLQLQYQMDRKARAKHNQLIYKPTHLLLLHVVVLGA